MSPRASQVIRYFFLALFLTASAIACQPTANPPAPATTVPATSTVAVDEEATNDERPTITLGFEDRLNPPYVLTEHEIDWEKPGISLEVLQLVAKELDINIEYERMPWARNLQQLEANQLDGVFHASFSTERLAIGAYPMVNEEVDPSRRMMSNVYYLYKLKDSPLTWDGEQFSNLEGQIGAIIGFSIVGDLQGMGVEVHEVADQALSLQMLTRGRLAGVADLGTMTDLYLEGHPDEFGDIVRVEPPLSSKDYYLILSHQFVKEQPELADAIWNEIRRIRESGEYDAIAQKYLATEP